MKESFPDRVKIVQGHLCNNLDLTMHVKQVGMQAQEKDLSNILTNMPLYSFTLNRCSSRASTDLFDRRQHGFLVLLAEAECYVVLLNLDKKIFDFKVCLASHLGV